MHLLPCINQVKRTIYNLNCPLPFAILQDIEVAIKEDVGVDDKHPFRQIGLAI